MKPGAGFFAVDRSIFDHPALRKPERFRAWQWLIAQAAWRAQGKRGTWGVVHLERGELATSTRILAKTWKWPQSNVRCFLDRLKRDGMITVKKTRSATRSPTGPLLEHDVSIISICNYEKFQNASTAAKSKPAQQPAHRPAEASAQTHMFPETSPPLTIQPSNQSKKIIGPGGEEKGTAPSAPGSSPLKHGTRSQTNGTIFIRKIGDDGQLTEEWKLYAEDFRSVTGAEPLPRYEGGYWFFYLGEAARPVGQRFRKAAGGRR